MRVGLRCSNGNGLPVPRRLVISRLSCSLSSCSAVDSCWLAFSREHAKKVSCTKDASWHVMQAKHSLHAVPMVPAEVGTSQHRGQHCSALHVGRLESRMRTHMYEHLTSAIVVEQFSSKADTCNIKLATIICHRQASSCKASICASQEDSVRSIKIIEFDSS